MNDHQLDMILEHGGRDDIPELVQEIVRLRGAEETFKKKVVNIIEDTKIRVVGHDKSSCDCYSCLWNMGLTQIAESIEVL